MDISALGFSRHFEQAAAALGDRNLVPMRIVRQERERYTGLGADGERSLELSGRMRHTLERAVDFPVVGDWVMVVAADPDHGLIQAVLPRLSSFLRQMVGVGNRAEAQVVAANIDTVFLVSGLDNDFNLRRIERYLTVAWESGARPVVVLNKADLTADREAILAEVAAVAVGVDILALSAATGEGIDQLGRFVAPGRTVALLGSSGVGKSTIANALLGEQRLATREVSEHLSKGRHTTTRRELVLLPGGGLLIDTPGMREIQLWGDQSSLAQTFADVDELAAECRFGDCTHESEPGCAVQAALRSGSLAEERWVSYLKQKRELAHLARRQDRTLQQIERDKWKKIHMSIRKHYRLRGRR